MNSRELWTSTGRDGKPPGESPPRKIEMCSISSRFSSRSEAHVPSGHGYIKKNLLFPGQSDGRLFPRLSKLGGFSGSNKLLELMESRVQLGVQLGSDLLK